MRNLTTWVITAGTVLTGVLPAHAMEMDHAVFTSVKIDQFEHRWQTGDDLYVGKGIMRVGTDEQKIALKVETEYLARARRFERAEFQLRYQHIISDFFDVYVGVRQDVKPSPSRSYGVVGLSGIAKQWFDVDLSAFLSERGTPSARLDAEYEILLTQKLVLEPSLELNASIGDDKAIDIGNGFTKLETGLRLRYEIIRNIAPYIGVNWERKLGETAQLVRSSGEDPDMLSAVAGIRFMF
ncbi:MAG: copper resistance protein B [Rhizobiales bacterium]|nr:copper resistance protein B [Hyphomicrobiales bacterium]